MMIELTDLPGINATLNSISFVLLVTGYVMIKQRRVRAHKVCMLAAFGVSILFLTSYLTYRFFGQEKHFGGQGFIRPVYFVLLITHVVLAMTIPVLASRTLYLALRGRFEKHRRIARITFPIWMYVSITGVLVYIMLFRIYGPASVEGPVSSVPKNPARALSDNGAPVVLVFER